MKRILRTIWLWMVLSVLAFSFISVLSSYIPPKYFWGLYFLSYSVPIALFLNCTLLGLYFFVKKRLWLIIVGIAISLFGLNNNWALNTNTNKAEHNYSLLTFNVRLFDIYNWLNGNAWDEWKERTDNGAVLDSIYTLIDNQNTDFICFQEYLNQNSGDYQTEKNLIKKGYKYSNIAYCVETSETQYGLATFSKYPIINKSEKFFGNYRWNNGILITDIKTPNDTLKIVNVHLESFRLGKKDYKYLHDISDSSFTNVETEQTKSLFKKIKIAFERRSLQLNYLLNVIDSSPHPIIICGDFNELPNSYLYRTLTQKLEDAFLEKGNGFGSTFISKIPGIRIDYILHSKAISTTSHEVIKQRLSDHYPTKYEFKTLQLVDDQK